MTNNETKRSTGPRTAAGKRRVRRNPLKHGIFAEIVLTGGEFDVALETFDDMVGELRESIRPTNSLQVVLVDKLAITLFRLSRVYQADSQVAHSSSEDLEKTLMMWPHL
jgi:hypothetical protein